MEIRCAHGRVCWRYQAAGRPPIPHYDAGQWQAGWEVTNGIPLIFWDVLVSCDGMPDIQIRIRKDVDCIKWDYKIRENDDGLLVCTMIAGKRLACPERIAMGCAEMATIQQRNNPTIEDVEQELERIASVTYTVPNELEEWATVWKASSKFAAA